MRRLAIAIAAAAIAGAAARAEADPALVLDRCPAFDPADLRAAIQRELAASRPDPRRDELTLSIQCPDAVTARLEVFSPPSSPTGSPDGRSPGPPPALPLGRSLDLGEVPGELRLKLLAVAAVELLDGAIAAPPPPPPEPAPPAEPPPPPAPASPREAARVVASPERPPEAPAASPSREALVPRIGLRVFPEAPVPLAHLSIDYERRLFSIGISATMGSNDVALGSVSALIVNATGATRPLCVGDASRACIRARGELGFARVKARASRAMVVASDARAPYAQVGLAVDLEHAFGALAALIAVEGGWAYGLTATAQSETAIQLDGGVVTVLAGLRWRP